MRVVLRLRVLLSPAQATMRRSCRRPVVIDFPRRRSPVSFPRRPPTWRFFGPYPILQGGPEVGLGGPPQCEADRPKSIKLRFADLSPLRDTAVAADQCGLGLGRQPIEEQSALGVAVRNDLGKRQSTLSIGPCSRGLGHDEEIAKRGAGLITSVPGTARRHSPLDPSDAPVSAFIALERQSRRRLAPW